MSWLLFHGFSVDLEIIQWLWFGGAVVSCQVFQVLCWEGYDPAAFFLLALGSTWGYFYTLSFLNCNYILHQNLLGKWGLSYIRWILVLCSLSYL